MAEAKAKTIVTMKLEATCPTHSRTDVVARDTETTIDEPTVRGGTNLGPSPTETLMAALMGCTNTITHKIAAANGIEIKEMSLRVETVFDRRGVTLQEEVDVPFPETRLFINLTTDAEDAKIDRLKADLAKFCPVSKVIRGAGTKLTEVWNISCP